MPIIAFWRKNKGFCWFFSKGLSKGALNGNQLNNQGVGWRRFFEGMWKHVAQNNECKGVRGRARSQHNFGGAISQAL
jgi:hypothetical protein